MEYDEEDEYSDFGARLYDAGLGRFNSSDPASSAFPSHSAYQTCHNNPVLYIDLLGFGPALPIGLKGTRNVIFVNEHYTKEENQEDFHLLPEAFEGFDSGNWDIIVVKNFADLGDLAMQYKEKYGSINNNLIVTHGSGDGGQFFGMGDKAKAISGADLEHPYFKDIVDSYTKLGTSLSKKSNVVISSCGLANGDNLVRDIYDKLTEKGNEVNLYTNYDWGVATSNGRRIKDGVIQPGRDGCHGKIAFNQNINAAPEAQPDRPYEGWRRTTKGADYQLKYLLRIAKEGFFYLSGKHKANDNYRSLSSPSKKTSNHINNVKTKSGSRQGGYGGRNSK